MLEDCLIILTKVNGSKLFHFYQLHKMPVKLYASEILRELFLSRNVYREVQLGQS